MTLSIDAMTEVERLPRDRRRDREMSDSHSADAEPVVHGSPKKRKRSRKTHLDNKFECKHEGCGKSYSRAEHLYRHQLNHTPKQIYRCDFPDCYRSFVRQDLCIRHRDRHTTHGSQLQKRDNFAQAAGNISAVRPPPAPPCEVVPMSANGPAAMASPPETLVSPSSTMSRPVQTNAVLIDGHHHHHHHHHPTNLPSLHAGLATTPMSTEPSYQPLTPQTGYGSSDSGIKQSDSASSYTLSPPKTQTGPVYGASTPQSGYGSMDSGTNGSGNGNSASTGTGGINQTTPSHPTSTGITPISTAYMPHLSSLSQPYLNSTLPQATTVQFTAAGLNALAPASAVGESSPESVAPPTYPVFGGETYNRSPFAMADDFAAWLFNDPSNSSPIGPPAVPGMLPAYPDSSQLQSPYYTNDTVYSNYFTNVVPQHPMSVTSILDPGPPETIMSEEKRQDLLHLISTRFNETSHSAVNTRKDVLMEGDIDADAHVLSLRMMQRYIGSYWIHFHTQLPILHKPTFVAEKTPNLLLLAIVAIGASTLDKIHGQAMTEAAADLANFIAWHVRWEIFMDADFRPPAKLWVFQALLLLEIYEKMYSTRALHERAHIHHDTTLTLMRRGSSLIGRSAFDSPASVREDHRHGRSSAAVNSDHGIGEESWAHWIKTEATRRVAFAAFVLDSIHATMFGHSAKMVAHEMRLPLPCDEALWSATSAAEVARMQASLQSNGVKPTMFLDGLKKTLTGQKVRTSAFGRTILMAGLLSVSWHMNQRDLQVSSLGVAQALGGRDKWRSALLRAYDNWKRDFDEVLAESGPRPYSNLFRQQYPVDDDDNIFESRTVLHHLAHMASHVDIVDCQIFAGAGRLLGRSITPKDYSTAREKMTERWATKASARDATFYALKFLAQVMLPDDSTPPQGGQCIGNGLGYCAREDFLLNRPWVLYFAVLVVWSYGYALEGPITPFPVLATVAEQHKDMQGFLERVGGVREPNDLETMTGRNRCLGLLMTLKTSFLNTRWELLHEAANLLESCITKSKAAFVEKSI
jgi:hypothetical protein